MRSPMPLAPFEAYMFADDRASHPMAFTIRLQFSGEFDQESFHPAVFDALGRHPLLSARVTKHGRRGMCWDWSEPPAPFVDIADEREPLSFPGSEQIDLGTGCGVRIWVRHGSNRCEMRLQFHHACTDGVGAYRFVEDLLGAYHNRTVEPERQISLRSLDPQLLEVRDRFGLNWLGVLMRLPLELWGIIVGFATFFLRRPAEVYAPPRLHTLDRCAVPDLPVHAFSDEEFRMLKQAAHRHGATLNDLLTSKVCSAMHTWNERHGAAGRRRPIRVVVPVNLRTQVEAAMPAANVVAMVFVDRKPSCYASPQRLLRTIAWELSIIKRFRLALAFVRGAAIARRIPGGLRFLTRASRCYATCVFSNVGVVLDKTPLPYHQDQLCAGELRLELVDFCTTVRPHTPVGLSCVTYAGRLRLELNYDRGALSTGAAEAILRTVLEQVGIKFAPVAVAIAHAA